MWRVFFWGGFLDARKRRFFFPPSPLFFFSFYFLPVFLVVSQLAVVVKTNGVRFWARCTTQFRTYFSGDGNKVLLTLKECLVLAQIHGVVHPFLMGHGDSRYIRCSRVPLGFPFEFPRRKGGFGPRKQQRIPFGFPKRVSITRHIQNDWWEV